MFFAQDVSSVHEGQKLRRHRPSYRFVEPPASDVQAVVDFLFEQIEPAGHAVQLEAPPVEYVPLGQCLEVVPEHSKPKE